MFSVRQKREIADKIQTVLRNTKHPELPEGEIEFELRVQGAESWSYADIQNNGAVITPGVNPWNEKQGSRNPKTIVKDPECLTRKNKVGIHNPSTPLHVRKPDKSRESELVIEETKNMMKKVYLLLKNIAGDSE